MAIGTLNEERRMALHDLMDRVVITLKDYEDAYRRVFMHERWLRSWFADGPSWRLLKGHGVYRLERLPSQALPERGLPRLREPMDYACLCWTLYLSERWQVLSQDWFVISELAAEITRVAAGKFSLAERSHREALVRSLRFLEDLNILLQRDGNAEAWASNRGAHPDAIEVLYEFVPDAPRLLANFDPVGLDIVTAVGGNPLQLVPTGEATGPLERAWRMLLLGPLLWQGDDPEAFAALREAAGTVAAALEEALGWQLEVQQHYARIWRTTTARHAGAQLIDLLPEQGDDSVPRHITYGYHPILLLIQSVRAQIDTGALTVGGDGAVAVSGDQVRVLIQDLHRAHRRNWGAELSEQLTLDEVVVRVMARMRQMGYLRGPDELDQCILLPAAAKFTGEYLSPAAPTGLLAAETTPSTQQMTLFGQEDDHASELD